jgi:formate hydrogenlyase subunit 4
MSILSFIIQIALTPVLSPLFIGIVRKVKARFQNRTGASIFQPYRDIWKLLHKDEVISGDASRVFTAAPYLIFSSTLVLGAGIPLFSTVFSGQYLGDLLTFIYLVAFGTFFLALAGLDVGSPFGGFGSSREMTIAALTEGGLMFSILSVAFLAHSTNLFTISAAVSSLSVYSFAPVIIAFAGFIIAMLAETARFPFDNPATHLELTMIHEAMILEYSGKRLALMEWAAANKFFIFLALGANLFLPWGISSGEGAAGMVLALAFLLVKVLGISLFVAVLESSMAKFRYFRLPDLLFVSFILSAIAINLTL